MNKPSWSLLTTPGRYVPSTKDSPEKFRERMRAYKEQVAPRNPSAVAKVRELIRKNMLAP